jgi:phage FluMu protein Com
MRSRHRMRCRPCRKVGLSQGHGHFTLRRAPDKYKRQPLCPRCKSDNVVSMEAATKARNARRLHNRCYCSNVPHPHGPDHQLCNQYPHEYLVMHWPHDHPFTIEKESELQEMYENVWSNKTRTRTF